MAAIRYMFRVVHSIKGYTRTGCTLVVDAAVILKRANR